ncbi:DUF393 domain-containing protein [Pedobacter sp.]|uniref:DUF393 domain-containing protein n=1 Tax=Pedobacter sp. TaxID=1411316 RepID=UPI0031D81863
MKTLANHLILYDANCPMCNIYTSAFVKTKMLDANGRKPYQEIPTDICPYVDMKRAVNEIALVNTETGQVSYGVASIFKILGNTMPIFKPLFALQPFIWLMSKVYALVSYNRKVIIPAKAKANELLPDFKLHYRLIYLFLSWFVTAYILTNYAKVISPEIPFGNDYREYFICGGQILFQGLVCLLYRPAKTWDYLANMMTISLAGSFLLLPMLWVGNALNLNALPYIAYFLLVAGLMFLEHLRRSKILGLGLLLSASWVIYRLLVLGLIMVD